jgi:uncharacterized UBP type Zn finger protein
MLQKNAAEKDSGKRPASTTNDLTRSFGWESADSFEQQVGPNADAAVLYHILSDALETKFKGTPSDGAIARLFEGKQEEYVKCLKCQTRSAREVVFKELQLTIRSYTGSTIKSVEEGLANCFSSERLDGGNQYQCDVCQCKCDADKGTSLSQPPYILCINLKRFEYDWERDRRVKVRGPRPSPRPACPRGRRPTPPCTFG